MSTGVGKTYRMLQEAHGLLKNKVDVRIGFIETHQPARNGSPDARTSYDSQKRDLFKGKKLSEVDVDSILLLRPDVVIVDKLAHIK